MAEEFGVKVKLIPEFDNAGIQQAISAAAKKGVSIDLQPKINTADLQKAVDAAAKKITLNIGGVGVGGSGGNGGGNSGRRSSSANIAPLINYYKNVVDYIRKNPAIQKNSGVSRSLSNEKNALAQLVRSAIQKGSYDQKAFSNSKNKISAIQNNARELGIEDTSTANKIIARLQKQVDSLRTKNTSLSNLGASNISTASNEYKLKEAERIIGKLKSASAESFGGIEADAQKAIASAKQSVESLSKSIKDTSTDLAPAYKILKEISNLEQPKKISLLDPNDVNELKKYRSQLEAMTGSGSYQKSDLKNITSGLAGIKYRQGEADGGFKSEVLTIAQGVTVGEAMRSAFYKAKQVAAEMVTTVREIDDALAQLTIVTGRSGSELDSFFQKAADSAYDMGHSVTEVLRSVETFSRLGYGLEDASQLADAATIMSNVADTTVDKSTVGLTSIIKGYGLEASDATRVSDVLAKVGKDYAISAEELMSALERGGAALNVANTSFEESVALAAAGNAAIQDPEKVGGQ